VAESHLYGVSTCVREPMRQMVVQYPDQVASPTGVLPVRPAGSRFSPLYCAYNGFLLGQFLALGFEQGALPLYALRPRSVLALLDEVGVPTSLPEERPDLGSDLHIEVLETLVPRIAQRSQLFADHVVLGSLLAHYGMLAAGHPLTAGTLMDEIEALVERRPADGRARALRRRGRRHRVRAARLDRVPGGDGGGSDARAPDGARDRAAARDACPAGGDGTRAARRRLPRAARLGRLRRPPASPWRRC
jgi:hypothetical protein